MQFILITLAKLKNGIPSIYNYFLILFLSLFFVACQPTEKELSQQERDSDQLYYQVTFNPELDRKISESLHVSSTLIKLESRPPTSLNALNRRAQNDVERFKKVLASEGYFSPIIDYSINETNSPIIVSFAVNPGNSYKIASVTVNTTDDVYTKPNLKNLTTKVLGIKIGDNINLDKINRGQEKLKHYFQHTGYPFAVVQEPEAVVDHQQKVIHITYFVSSGSYSVIKETKVIGLKSINSTFVKNRILWSDGQPYDEKVVEKTRRKLIDTGLFSGVVIKPEPDNTNEKNPQPIFMTVGVTESPPRALGAGVKFSSSEKIGGKLYWHHNNVFGSGEHFGASVRTSKILSRVKLEYDTLDFLQPQQKLLNEISGTVEHNRAYVGRVFAVGSSIQRPLNDIITASVGVREEIGRVRREDTTYNLHLTSLPTELKMDVSNDLLNPTRGGKLSAKLTPYVGRLRANKGMLVSRLGGTFYLPISIAEAEKDNIVLANFVNVGSIAIKGLDDIPPNKRFYSGGGGSVRGYGYQLLGPLDSQRVPIGGRSLTEFGTELRLKMTETFGIVTFLEAGSVSEKKMPDFKTQNLLWGTGFGVRYYSAIGPLRLDIGVPLSKRTYPGSSKKIDSPVQFYVSVGQAF